MRLVFAFRPEKIPGNHNKGETPVPIPNTEVKPFSADGTARGAEWESRSLPGFFICLAMVDGRGMALFAQQCKGTGQIACCQGLLSFISRITKRSK